MISAHKFGLAVSAFGETNGKLKLDDLQTFFMKYKNESYQIIVNKGKRLIRFKNGNRVHQSNENFIIFKNCKNIVQNCFIEKTTTITIYETLTTSREWVEKELKTFDPKQNSNLKMFLSQFENVDDEHISSNPNYNFCLKLDELDDNLKIKNNIGNVYFYYRENAFGATITKSFYDEETNTIHTNDLNGTKRKVSATIGNLGSAKNHDLKMKQTVSDFESNIDKHIEFLQNFKKQMNVKEIKVDLGNISNMNWFRNNCISTETILNSIVQK